MPRTDLVFLTGTNFPHVLRDNKNDVLHAGLSFVGAQMNRDRIDRSGTEARTRGRL